MIMAGLIPQKSSPLLTINEKKSYFITTFDY